MYRNCNIILIRLFLQRLQIGLDILMYDFSIFVVSKQSIKYISEKTAFQRMVRARCGKFAAPLG